VDANTRIQDTLPLLNENSILSVPVLRQRGRIGGEEEEGARCIGLVDTLDVLALLVQICTKPIGNSEVGESTNLKTDDLKIVARRSEEFRHYPVGQIMNLSGQNPYVTVSETETVKEVSTLLRDQRLHRVAVMDRTNKNKIKGILTQHDVLRFMRTHDLLSVTVSQREVGEIVPSRLVMASEITRAIDVCTTMHKERISSVPIVNPTGGLTSVFSASELKTISGEYEFRCLLDTATTFVKMAREKQGMDPSYLGTCSPTTRVNEVVEKMLKDHLHRIYVVDPQGMKLIGVVSLTDLIF